MRASPVTIIIIYSLQCTLLLRKRATGCPRVPPHYKGSGAAAPAAPVAPAPLEIAFQRLSISKFSRGASPGSPCAFSRRQQRSSPLSLIARYGTVALRVL